jgi:hypothetical protein
MWVDYVYELHVKVVDRKTPEEIFQEQKEEEERLKREAEENDELKKEVEMLETEVDEFTRSLYEDVITMNRQAGCENSNALRKDENYYREKRRALYETIKAQVITYIKYCRDMNMMLTLEQYGNELYKNDILCNLVNRSKISIYCDAIYVAKYFDLLMWWKQEGSRSFVEISCAALVLLGKPTHNAFQERVFSRGTYKDSVLKKKLKEDKFEMSVLNSLNGAQVKNFVEKGYCTRIVEDNLVQRVNAFFEKSSGTNSIIASGDPNIVNDNDSDSVSINIDAEYAYMLDSDSESETSDEEIIEETGTGTTKTIAV